MAKEFLDWFVNRDKQYRGFTKMLAHDTERLIMRIQAGPDMGKTWLIQRMHHHAEAEKTPVVHVDFRDRRPYDYLSLVRLARDQFTSPHFNLLTATINKFTEINVTITTEEGTGSVELAAGDVVQVGGDVAGRDIIKDNQFYIKADSDMSRRVAEIQINDAFIKGLIGLVAEHGTAVFLFDSFEEATVEARRWLKDHLLLQIREGRLPNTIVVFAGREVDDFGQSYKGLVASTGLDMFSEKYIHEYLIERRQITDLDVDTVFRTSGGLPGLLAKMADLAGLDDNGDETWFE